MKDLKYLPSCYVIGAKSVAFVPGSLPSIIPTSPQQFYEVCSRLFLSEILFQCMSMHSVALALQEGLCTKKKSLPMGFSHIHLPTDSVQGMRCLPGWTCLRPTVETMSRESSVGHNVFEKLCARLPRGERFEDVELDERYPTHRLDSGAETCPAREASRTLYTSVCCSEHDANTSRFAT